MTTPTQTHIDTLTAPLRRQPNLTLCICRRLLLALVVFYPFNAAHAWVYPEHRDIALLAVQDLDAQYKADLDRMWQSARAGDEQRLCERPAEDTQGLAPKCIDWAALTAIGGDHSCSSHEMLETVRASDWILVVADVAARLKVDLARIPLVPGALVQSDYKTRQLLENEKSRAKRSNALRTADTRLQHADAKYATRADANLAHFLLSRPDTNLDPVAYASLTLAPGSRLNAIGVYAWYHIRALQKASRLTTDQLTSEERREWSRAALFDEAFALHFLEDAFAAGHIAGSWGDVSQRKGTHDFYNENGLEVFTWSRHDRTIVLMGDAHMRKEDAQLAAQQVRISLEQLLDAARGRTRTYELPHDADVPASPGTFDICISTTFPESGVELGSAGHQAYAAALRETLLDTPVPGLAAGLGALPRARSEVGAFIGLAGSLDGRWTSGGFAPSENNGGGITSLDIGLRGGVGLEGALRDSGDGLVFGQIGFHQESHSTNAATGTGLASLPGILSSAIPSRTGMSTRIRMPFYVIPGDLLLLSPMYFFNPSKYTEFAVIAANGGLIPMQRGWATPIGRFQFMLGREIGATWFGLLNKRDELAAPGAGSGQPSRVVSYRSVFVDFPIFEYRPYRAFSSKQSSAVLFQLFAGVDIPYNESTTSPSGAPPVNLHSIYSLGIRMVFDWRYYP